jgi:hypothetical protein
LTVPAGARRPRPVYCVTEHLRRDPAIAEDASRGRFTELGLTLELGVVPDWITTDFPADEEWRIAWGKFYFGLDLAAAFGATGEPHYQRAWEQLVASWIDQVPIGVESTDTVARRLLNWIYAWNRLADAPAFTGLDGDLSTALIDSCAAQAAWLRGHLTPARNHRTLELYSLFVVALALPPLDADGESLEFALQELDRNLATDFRADGVHIESSTHYHLVALRSFVGLRENARRFALELPAGFDKRLERALDFAMHCHRPDGQIPALSDSDSGSYAELLELAADLLDRPDYLYAATRGARGTRPRGRHVSFPAGGYHVQRSGWGEGAVPFAHERFLIFDCGPLGEGGHGHYDLLSVEIAAGGRPLVLDPGRYTYHEGDPNLRHWFKGTAAHNTVCVDGLDQSPYFRRKPRGAIAEADFRGRTTVPGLDVLWGAATSPCYEARHARRVLFVAGEYWVFEDRLWGQRPHRYDQRWHLAPDAQGAVELRADGHGALALAPGLALIFAPGVELALEAGWYAPAYGIRHPAPVLSATRDGALDATLITLAVPLVGGVAPPGLRVASSDPSQVSIQVHGVGAAGTAHDTIGWSVDGASATFKRTEAVAA